MATFVELHIIQNFAPSNLNRDDSNTPKDCEFGGYRRARISSQCIKRSVRRHPAFARAVEEAGGDTGVRTKRLKGKLVEIFVDGNGKPEEEAANVAQAVIEAVGLKLKDKEKTEYLLYFGEGETSELARIAIDSWDVMAAAGIGQETEGKKKKTKGDVPEELVKVRNDLKAVVGARRKEARSYAADIALFGRMVADDKNMNVDAASQVAHAISTNKVEMEMDYFTAVDDLLPDEESGSDMIGVVEFNSSCFYRYSNINLDKLRENLGMNADLTAAAVLGYIEASVKAVPTGKQNSMAAQNPAGYVRVIVRRDGFPWSLANAFQKPVRAGAGESLEEISIVALESYFDRLKNTYGAEDIVCDTSFSLHSGNGTLPGLLSTVRSALAPNPPGTEGR